MFFRWSLAALLRTSRRLITFASGTYHTSSSCFRDLFDGAQVSGRKFLELKLFTFAAGRGAGLRPILGEKNISGKPRHQHLQKALLVRSQNQNQKRSWVKNYTCNPAGTQANRPRPRRSKTSKQVAGKSGTRSVRVPCFTSMTQHDRGVDTTFTRYV